MCDHTKTKMINASKEVAGLTFNYKALQCENCDAVQWSKETEALFHSWLGQQKKVYADRFTIQKVAIDPNLAVFALELAEKHHSTESAVYQACLSLYFILGAAKRDIMQEIDSIQPEISTGVLKKFRINPSLFVKVEANARLFNMNMNEVASWVIQRVLTAAQGDKIRAELDFALAA